MIKIALIVILTIELLMITSCGVLHLISVKMLNTTFDKKYYSLIALIGFIISLIIILKLL
jgi:hypothetical protein